MQRNDIAGKERLNSHTDNVLVFEKPTDDNIVESSSVVLTFILLLSIF